MNDHSESKPATRSALGVRTTLIACAVVLAVAAAVTLLIFSTEPEAQRETATRRTAMLVETIEAERATFRPQIVETGVVMPARDIRLSPQINGRIAAVHANFVPGGLIGAGETIVEIEASDYDIALRQAQSDLLQAETDLKLEMGRQEIARQDYRLLEDILPDGDTSLVLREPQLAAARVRVDAARAAVDQARLNLERTRIRSPFAAQILELDANVGSQVSGGVPLARLVGVDTYWVMATVGLAKIPWLGLPAESDTRGAAVQLRNRSAWPPGTTRTGYLLRLVGALEEQTRLARVVIEVDDPLARSTPGLPPLLVGEYLEVRITGKPIDNVVRLSRDHLRQDDTAWVMDADDRLRIRRLDIVFKDAQYAYVRNGLDDGERIVTSNLATVTDGAELRLETGTPSQ